MSWSVSALQRCLSPVTLAETVLTKHRDCGLNCGARLRMKKAQAALIVGLLLSALLMPHAASGDPSGYSITLVQQTGVFGDVITARVFIDEPDPDTTYHLCWNQPLRVHSVAQFRPTQTTAGNFTVLFTVPEDRRGNHTLHLIQVDDTRLGDAAVFTIRPTVSISPLRGPSGTQVSIKGYGFSANEANIPVSFDGSSIGPAAADARGSWDRTHSIPTRARGSYRIEVGPDSADQQLVWHEHFVVTPDITVDPTVGVVGQTFQVSGTGFATNESAIRIIFDGEAVQTGITAGANGSWTASAQVPVRPAGTYKVDAAGAITWPREIEDVEFTIGTGVSVRPASAHVGDEVTVAGGGFRARETGIRITFRGTAIGPEITADRDGAWKASFLVPASPGGPQVISASGDQTAAAEVGTASLTVLATIAVSPGEASPGDLVSLTGSGFHANQGLTVRFAGVSTPVDDRTMSNGNVGTVVRVPPSPAGTLTLTVTCQGGAEASTAFTVTEKVLPTPQPASPAEGRRQRGRDISFEWGRVAGEHDVTYSLQIADSEAFTTVRWSDSGIEGEQYVLPRETLESGEYYWRVRAVDEFGNESQWSEPRLLRVAPVPTWVWVLIGLVVLAVLVVVAYRETRFRVTG